MSDRKFLIYGDSNTYGFDPADLLERRYPYQLRWTSILQNRLAGRWEVLPEGMNGRRLPELAYDARRLRKFTQMLTADDLFAVMLGTNDILLTMDPDASEAIVKMDLFLQFLTATRSPETILVIAPPHIAHKDIRDPLCHRYFEESVKMNRGFRILAEKTGVRFLDAGEWNISLCSDLVHFSEKGHAAFAEKLAQYLIEPDRIF